MKTAIDRLLECPAESLTLAEASYVLGPSEATLARLVNKQAMGSLRYGGRGTGMKQRILIPRGSIIRQLVRMSMGDARADLIREIETKFREMLPFAQMEAETAPACPKALPAPVKRQRVLSLPRRSRPDERQMNLF